jgi:hypothetical protein
MEIARQTGAARRPVKNAHRMQIAKMGMILLSIFVIK